MTYKEFCEAVDGAAVPMIVSGPYIDTDGESHFRASRVDKKSLKGDVGSLLTSGCSVYVQKGGFMPETSSVMWISVQSQNTGENCELITP